MPRTVSMALISLTRDEVSRLARGDLRVVGQGASYRETFQGAGRTDGPLWVSSRSPRRLLRRRPERRGRLLCRPRHALPADRELHRVGELFEQLVRKVHLVRVALLVRADSR